MAKKQEPKSKPVEVPVEDPKELTGLEAIEAEMRAISPNLKDLKRNDPARYKQVYKHYMWLVGERDRLKAEESL